MKKYQNLKIPAKAGIGLRSVHYKQIANEKPDIAWLEVHTENFFSQGGLLVNLMDKIRSNYPLSLHGVGLSLGSSELVKDNHLKKVKDVIELYQPDLISEHISWSNSSQNVMNDLLPLPYNSESLKVICRNIDYVQNFLNRQILVENPSTYLEFKTSTMQEVDFVNEISKISGCGILFDVNNVFVGHKNHGINFNEYLEKIDLTKIQEVHLAGHAKVKIEGQEILIDDHGHYICDEVWQIYEKLINKTGSLPTLIEWDNNIPSLDVLINEANKAQKIIDSH